MLSLPIQWRGMGARQLIEVALCDAHLAGIYHPVACALTHALLEQLAESRWKKLQNPPAIKRRRYGFEVNDALFHVLPQLDNQALTLVPKLAKMRKMTTVLVPPWSDVAARRLFAKCEATRSIDIQGLQDYASLRILFTTLDLQVDRVDALSRLFWWYNRIARSSCGGTCSIKIPCSRDSSPEPQR